MGPGGTEDGVQRAAFPFMKLPAELRLNIYEFLLGGRTIHSGHPCLEFNDFTVADEERKKTMGLCQASITDAEYTLSRRSKTTVSHFEDPFTDRHYACCRKRLPPFLAGELNILFACREIYTEAMPVVFKANTFTFANSRVLDRFLRKLTNKQRESIAALLIYETQDERFWQGPPRQRLAERLSGLRQLTLYVELCPPALVTEGYVDDDEYDEDLGDPEYALFEERNRRVLFQSLQSLKGLDLQSTAVHIDLPMVDTVFTRDMYGRELYNPTNEELGQWEEEIRQTLLPVAKKAIESWEDGPKECLIVYRQGGDQEPVV